MRRPTTAVGLAFGALAFAVVALAGPANVDRATFTWSAASDSLDVPLVLTAKRPESIEVRVPCALARRSRAGAGQALFTTSVLSNGLVVAGDGRDLWVRVGTTEVVSLPISASAPCDARVSFHIDPGLLRLTVGRSSKESRLDRDAQPIVTALHAGPETAGTALRARIVTQPTGSSPSWHQLLAILAAIACGLAASVLLLRGSGPRGTRASGTWLRTPLVAASDGVVAAAALASIVLTPAMYDDGWILATVRGFAGTGRFSTYFDRDAGIVFQGGWWDALLYPFMSTTDNVVVLRLLFVGSAALAWWVVRRWVLDQWSDRPAHRRAARFGGAATAVLLIPAWMTTLRTEPVMALVAAVGMAATLRFFRSPGLAPLTVVIATGGLAVITHPVGWAVVAAAAPASLFVVPWLRERQGRERLVALAAVTIVAASVCVLLAGFDTDVALLRRAAVDFTRSTSPGPGYSYGPTDEWVRWLEVIESQSAARRAAMVLPLLGLIGAVVARPRRYVLNAQRLALWCSVGGYLGLTLTSSKLPWHYGAVMPFSIVLVAAGFQRLLACRSGWPALKRGAAAVCLVLLGAWVLSTDAEWNPFDLSSTTWSELRRVDLLGRVDLSRPIVWLTALALAGGGLVALRVVNHRSADVTRRTLALSLGAVCLVPVGLTWSLLLGDARSTDGWSFTGQLLSSATGRDVCGLPEKLPVVVSVAPLGGASGPDDVPRAARDAYFHAPTNSRLPTPRVDTWGTWVASEGASRTLTTGRFSTPWYEVPHGADLAFWTVGRTGGPNRLVLEARDSSGAVTETPIEPTTDTLYWSIKPVPALAREVVALRLVLTDNDVQPGGWLAATAPARVDYRPFASTLSPADRVWVSPEFHLYAPCVELPSISDGYVHPFAASVVTPPDWGTFEAVMQERPVIEIGCFGTGPRGVKGPTARPCAYRVEFADAAELLEE